jgi:GntR family transcriptional repressor for pyruvate dehydrogenase complex
VRRGDGTYVTSLEPHLLLEAISFVADMHDDDSLLEIFAVRRMLESQATGLAATLGTAEAIDALHAELDGIDPSVSVDELVEHDIRFHRDIVRMAGNTYLASLIDSLSGQTVRARIWRGLTEQGAVERTLSEHRGIADAIAQHDPNLATSLTTAHIAGIERWLRQAAAVTESRAEV